MKNNQIKSLISNIDFKLNNGFLFHSISIDKWNDIYKKEILNLQIQILFINIFY